MKYKQYTEYELEKLKKLELMILEEVITICDNHNIDYYIFAGTALGAVRHEGFIPWDDDVDIALFRKDYEKLLEILDEELDSKFSLITMNKQKDCFFQISKVCLKNTKFEDWWVKQVSFDEGIYIDIFPLDNIPISKIKRLTYYYRCQLINFIVINSIIRISDESSLLSKFRGLLFAFLNKIPISINYWKKVYHNTLTKYENTETEAVTCYFSQISNSTLGKGGFFLKKDFQPPNKVKFENLIVSAPHNADAILKKCYGNYMELPPEDKRVNHAPEVLDFGDY